MKAKLNTNSILYYKNAVFKAWRTNIHTLYIQPQESFFPFAKKKKIPKGNSRL